MGDCSVQLVSDWLQGPGGRAATGALWVNTRCSLSLIGYRALEEGRLQDAETEKYRIEQAQRERRKKRDEERVVYSPKWFM